MEQKAGVPILISLNSNATVDGAEADAVQLLTSGQLLTNSNQYRIRYEEQFDEDVPPTQVELSMANDVITMLRTGDYETQMVFRKGQRYEGQYTTPYGIMELAIFCTRAAYEVDDVGGSVRLQYQLDLNGQFISMHETDLRFVMKDGDH